MQLILHFSTLSHFLHLYLTLAKPCWSFTTSTYAFSTFNIFSCSSCRVFLLLGAVSCGGGHLFAPPVLAFGRLGRPEDGEEMVVVVVPSVDSSLLATEGKRVATEGSLANDDAVSPEREGLVGGTELGEGRLDGACETGDGSEDEARESAGEALGKGDFPTHFGFLHNPFFAHLFLFPHLEQLSHLGMLHLSHSLQADHMLQYYTSECAKNQLDFLIGP